LLNLFIAIFDPIIFSSDTFPAGNAKVLLGWLPTKMLAEELDLIADIRLDNAFWASSRSLLFTKEVFPMYFLSQYSENIRAIKSGWVSYILEDGSRAVCSMESNPGKTTSASTPWAAQNSLIIGEKWSAVKSERKTIFSLVEFGFNGGWPHLDQILKIL